MLTPLSNYVLVKVINNSGGIVMTATESQRGKVISVGEGQLDLSSGKRTEMFVKKDDVVIWQKFADSDYSFEEDGEEYTLINVSQIMAKE